MAKERIGLGTRLVIGGIAGFVATLAMTSAMRHLHRRLPGKERYPLPPREIVDSALAPPPALAPELTIALHFAYGAGCGALLAAADPRIGRFGGALAGGAVWLTSYMGWIPAFGVLKPATRHPVRRDALMIGVHFAWGWSTAEAMRELLAARETIVAGGSDKDA
ncbi:MAG: hypothetical protein QOH47_2578 [Sphingomonadales bacterium]|jgi:uncharacterized membrane protein YagU involved in acid resistance|nr:hypothetical protein [Sphingomonadales bacterium]